MGVITQWADGSLFVGRCILAFWKDGKGIEEGRDLEEGENFGARMLGRLLLEDC